MHYMRGKKFTKHTKTCSNKIASRPCNLHNTEHMDIVSAVANPCNAKHQVVFYGIEEYWLTNVFKI